MDEEKFLGSGGGRAGKPPPYQAAVEDLGRRCPHGRGHQTKISSAAATGASFQRNPSFSNMAEKFSALIPVRPVVFFKIPRQQSSPPEGIRTPGFCLRRAAPQLCTDLLGFATLCKKL